MFPITWQVDVGVFIVLKNAFQSLHGGAMEIVLRMSESLSIVVIDFLRSDNWTGEIPQ